MTEELFHYDHRITRRDVGFDDEQWQCRFPLHCVMGGCLHHRSECCHIDDAAHYYEMLSEPDFTTTKDESL